ncbi:MAG: TIGR01906 family membrane protein [Lachnospiraceae bacterium]|nr:TIGR01906 family membrane protein [Lachnospiraceae bacterium]
MAGNSKKKKHVILNIATAAVFFAFLLSAATFAVLAFTPLYDVLIRLFKVPEETGYSAEVCRVNYRILIDYNMFWGAKELVFRDFRMSANGAEHFREVKTIFVILQFTAIGAFLALIPLVYAANRKKTYWWRKAAIFIALFVIVIVGTGMLFDWQGTFVLFHKILFRNDFWIFDPSLDPIIHILPDGVFLTDGALILFLMAAGLVAAGVVYHVKTHPKKKAKKNG